MKYIVILFFLIGFTVSTPPIFGVGQNLFYGSSSVERIPHTIIPGIVYDLEMKFQYTESEDWLRDISTEVQISPKGAESYVHVDLERIHASPRAISRTPITLQVDPEIPYEKIFIGISFLAKNSIGDQLRSSWMNSLILDVGNETSLPLESISEDKSDTKHNLRPLQQFKSGIAIDEIKCKENMVLLQKHDGSPACVTESTKLKLIEREWTGEKSWTVSNDRQGDANLYEEYRRLEKPPFPVSSLSNQELRDELQKLAQSGLPISTRLIDYDLKRIVLYSPDLTIENKIAEILGDTPFVLLYEEAPPQWEHDGPVPEEHVLIEHPCQQLAFDAFTNTTLKHTKNNTDSNLSVGYGDGENEEFLRSIGCYENRHEWQTQKFLDYLNGLIENEN